AKVAMPTAEERTRLMTLGADVEGLWHHPGASAETRKHILRTAIVEIVAKIVGDTIDLVVLLAGWKSYPADGRQEPRGSAPLDDRGRNGRTYTGLGGGSAL